VLRVLQDGEVEPVGAAKVRTVDVRVLAATNKDLPEEIREGRFREDLYFRLNVIPVGLPPLRERTEAIPRLVEHFVESFCTENNFRPKRFEEDALAAMAALPWRGNVRELRNAVERLIIMSAADVVRAADLPAGLGADLGAASDAPTDGPGTVRIDARSRTLQSFKDEAERAFLLVHLEQNDWNVAATAKSIETPRSNLYKKLEAYDIRRDGAGDA
jgi:two-component system nitrogen regulation response regulator NtrX